ncbi:MAG TPA: GNAT family N-acetyltransferase [Rhodanobacteraceae bacterium]|nr:GNAT family N-acetyltransferase [Rhodanobacteraceae bacterium]
MRVLSAGSSVQIRPALLADAERICVIYNHYVTNTIVTFEEELVTASEMRERMTAVVAKNLPWLVLERDGAIAGVAYAAPWKTRIGYRFTVESSIYLAPEQVGQSLGALLYGALLEQLRALKVHCVIGGAALPNPASIALHEKLGFTKIAHFRENGVKFGRWIDVAYWQRLFD